MSTILLNPACSDNLSSPTNLAIVLICSDRIDLRNGKLIVKCPLQGHGIINSLFVYEPCLKDEYQGDKQTTKIVPRGSADMALTGWIQSSDYSFYEYDMSKSFAISLACWIPT